MRVVCAVEEAFFDEWRAHEAEWKRHFAEKYCLYLRGLDCLPGFDTLVPAMQVEPAQRVMLQVNRHVLTDPNGGGDDVYKIIEVARLHAAPSWYRNMVIKVDRGQYFEVQVLLYYFPCRDGVETMPVPWEVASQCLRQNGAEAERRPHSRDHGAKKDDAATLATVELAARQPGLLTFWQDIHFYDESL